jgi:D-xylose reductase
VRYARSLGVQIQAYSSFGNLSQKKPGDLIFEQEPIKQAAAKYNKSPAQISLRWALQRGTIIMPKSERVERLQENMELFDFSLTDAEMKAITKLDRNCRFLDPAVFTDAANCFQPIYE